jgi:2-phosphoglycerate kinase
VSLDRDLLIGGPPGAGKTTLARAVAAELRAGSVTGSDLVTAVRRLTTADSHPGLHRGRAVGHVRYFTESEPEQLIADALELEAAMWPAILDVVRYHAADRESVVLDWWLMSPRRVADIGDAVHSAWLVIDPTVLEARERNNAWFWDQSPDPERMLANFMARSRWRNELVAEEAADLGLPIIHQPGDRPVEDLAAEVIALVE